MISWKFFFIVLGITAVILFATVYICLKIATKAIIFSKVSFSVLLALIISVSDWSLFPFGVLPNFIIWAIIISGVFLFLSKFPRINTALTFCSTNIIAIFVFEIVAVCVFPHIVDNAEEYLNTIYFEISVKLLCAGITVWKLFFNNVDQPAYLSTNPILKNIERLTASLIYALTIMFMSLPLNSNRNMSGVAIIIVFLGALSISFILDIFITKRADKTIDNAA